MKSVLIVSLVVLMASILGYWVIQLRPGANVGYVRLGASQRSPSGTFTAYAETGPSQNGVSTLIAVIRDKNNSEVFRDTEAYSNHSVGIIWSPAAEQLWLLSSDIGHSYVQIDYEGHWKKTYITPKTMSEMPAEIQELTRREQHR